MKKARALITICISAVFAQTAVAQVAVPLGCFERRYSDAHLAAHPDQGVAALWLRVSEEGDFPGESYFFMRAEMSHQGQAAHDGVAGMVLFEGGICRLERGNCFVECDGGGFDVVAFDGDALTIETRGMRLTLDGCDSAYVSGLNEFPDRATRYRLFRADPAICET